jgi:hypothetical protein
MDIENTGPDLPGPFLLQRNTNRSDSSSPDESGSSFYVTFHTNYGTIKVRLDNG